jgi:predicted DNA binding CopG/RHH family protein
MRLKGNSEIFTISLPFDIAERVKQKAKEKRLTYSAFIRMILAEKLFKEEEKNVA